MTPPRSILAMLLIATFATRSGRGGAAGIRPVAGAVRFPLVRPEIVMSRKSLFFARARENTWPTVGRAGCYKPPIGSRPPHDSASGRPASHPMDKNAASALPDREARQRSTHDGDEYE